MEDETGTGENIWDVSSWNTDVAGKKFMMQGYFQEMEFPDRISKLLEFVECYCTSIFGGEFERVTDLELTNKEIVCDFIDEFIFELADGQDFTALEELKLLHAIVVYFHNQKMDIVRCAVFDCLFGDIWEGKCHNKQSKFDLLCKLVSMAVGTQTSVILNCAGVWLQRHGCSNRVAKNLITALISDYCQLIPNTATMLQEVINVSPTFVSRFTTTVTELYHFGSREDEKEFTVPPKVVVEILSEWILNRPEFCMTTIPRSFLLMPTIYNTNEDLEVIRDVESNKPYLGLIRWTSLFPIYFDQTVSAMNDKVKANSMEDVDITNAPKSLTEADSLKLTFSKLHYGLLQFLYCQNKISHAINSGRDNLEPGEVPDEGEAHELISQRDLQLMMDCIVNFMDSIRANPRLKCPDGIDASVEHFSRVIQIAKCSKSITMPRDVLKSICQDLPDSRLLKLVLTA